MTVYHFVGIKGTGMSSLAQILHDMKHTVQGSDYEKRFFTQIALEKRGISILPFCNGKCHELFIGALPPIGGTLLFRQDYSPYHSYFLPGLFDVLVSIYKRG